MDLLSLFAGAAGTATATGAAVGAVAVAAGASAKAWLDHRVAALTAAGVPSRADLRAQAAEQARTLNRSRVAAGVPAGGQFAARDRADGDVSL